MQAVQEPTTDSRRVSPVPEGPQVPHGPEDLAAYYDLTISHPQSTCPPSPLSIAGSELPPTAHGLSFALLHDGVRDEATRRLTAGAMSVGFHLDYFAEWHRPGDGYARLAEAVEDAGGRSVNPVARARAFTDKTVAHGELQRHGLGVPSALIFRAGTPARPLTLAERQRLRLDDPDAGLYVKPANGCGGKGVIRTTADDFPDALAAARAQEPGAYLVQREVRPPLLHCDDGVARPAYWRVVVCLGELTAFWWRPAASLAPGQTSYRLVSRAEFLRYRLQPLLRLCPGTGRPVRSGVVFDRGVRQRRTAGGPIRSHPARWQSAIPGRRGLSQRPVCRRRAEPLARRRSGRRRPPLGRTLRRGSLAHAPMAVAPPATATRLAVGGVRLRYLIIQEFSVFSFQFSV